MDLDFEDIIEFNEIPDYEDEWEEDDDIETLSVRINRTNAIQILKDHETKRILSVQRMPFN